jgi:hypothetical protein
MQNLKCPLAHLLSTKCSSGIRPSPFALQPRCGAFQRSSWFRLSPLSWQSILSAPADLCGTCNDSMTSDRGITKCSERKLSPCHFIHHTPTLTAEGLQHCLCDEKCRSHGAADYFVRRITTCACTDICCMLYYLLNLVSAGVLRAITC